MCFLDSTITATEQVKVLAHIERRLRLLKKLGYCNLKYPDGGICSSRCEKYKHLSKDIAICDLWILAREVPVDGDILHGLCEGEYCHWMYNMDNRVDRRVFA